MSFPSIPGWDGIHPAMVQFPIALLLAAPILLIVSLFVRGAWRAWATAALVVMALGVFTAWLAVGTGHAAAQLVEKSREVSQAISSHEALAVTTRNLFTLLAVVLAVLVLLPDGLRKPLPAPLRIGSHALFVVVYLGCTLFLLSTADRGGRLVHESGVRALVTQSPPPAAPATPTATAPQPAETGK